MALMSVLDVDVEQNINDFIPRRPNISWDEVGASKMIYKTKHIVTYRWNDEGGYVYFYKERPPGWFRWNKTG